MNLAKMLPMAFVMIAGPQFLSADWMQDNSWVVNQT